MRESERNFGETLEKIRKNFGEILARFYGELKEILGKRSSNFREFFFGRGRQGPRRKHLSYLRFRRFGKFILRHFHRPQSSMKNKGVVYSEIEEKLFLTDPRPSRSQFRFKTKYVIFKLSQRGCERSTEK